MIPASAASSRGLSSSPMAVGAVVGSEVVVSRTAVGNEGVRWGGSLYRHWYGGSWAHEY